MYRGKVINGVIVLDGSPRLPEGAEVRIDVVANGQPQSPRDGPPWGEVFRDLVGKAQGLPSDMARNHDHYLHGAPRK